MLGYQYVHDTLKLGVLPPSCPASVRPVIRIERLGDRLAVPAKLAPGSSIVDHLLFALKHEGTDLALIEAAAPHLEPAALLDALRETPGGTFIRLLCCLWERFTGQQLEDRPELRGVPVPVFDPERYVTADAIRIRRWRVDWNGLGDWTFCPSVRRTPELDALVAADPLSEARTFLAEVTTAQLERVLAWAYLHETRSSYEIEGEVPPSSKAEAFAALLREAHVRRPLDEPTLVALQNVLITNPLLRAVSFRADQNYLANGVPGTAGVTYVPPPPEELPGLLASLSKLANGDTAPGASPLVRAALVSFGFVFTHPFHDGNGRLSRFLAHYTLCQTGALPDGYILPLSTAMKRHEAEYLRALQSFSRPARTLWDVRWLDGDEFQFTFRGHPAVYRFFDATPIVAFFHRMAQETLRHDMRGEVEFLDAYDAVTRAVDERYDVANTTLAKLVVMAYRNNGVVSRHRRKQFSTTVPEEVFDFIEEQLRARRAAGNEP